MPTSTALLKSLESGDTAIAEARISEETYIQHNLRVPDGRAALLGILPALAQSGTRVNTLRSFKDGDFTFHHSEYHLFGEHQVGFDVFRSEGGKIVEHWDNLQQLAGPNPSGRTMLDGATEIRDLDQTEANKALVASLIQEVFQKHRFDRLPDYISATTYLQHNPHVADGLEGLLQAKPFLAKFHYEKVFKVLGQGNFVLAMSQIQFDGQEAAVYDLFRVEAGKVVEHWDVLEPIPPRNEWKHGNGKF